METAETIGPVAKGFYWAVLLAYFLVWCYVQRGNVGESFALWFVDSLILWMCEFSVAVGALQMIQASEGSGIRRWRAAYTGTSFGAIAVVVGLVRPPPGNAMFFLHLSLLWLLASGMILGLLVFDIFERKTETEA